MAGVLKTTTYDGRGRGHYRIGGAWDPNISSEEAIIVANSGAMVAGTVLGKITASGKYGKYDPAAADGRELPANAAILYADTPNLAVDQKATIDVRDGAVNGNALTWPAATTGPQKAALYAAVAARSLMVRF